MFKKWLAVLVTVVLFVCTFQLLWGTGGGGGEEHPWNQADGGSGTGGTSNVTSSASSSLIVAPLKNVFIVRPAPMGGFYIVRVSLPSDASIKTAGDGKKVAN